MHSARIKMQHIKATLRISAVGIHDRISLVGCGRLRIVGNDCIPADLKDIGRGGCHRCQTLNGVKILEIGQTCDGTALRWDRYSVTVL